MSSSATTGGTRREMLLALGCAAGLSAILLSGAFPAGSGPGSPRMQTLQYLLFRPRFARSLGELYRQRFPDDELSRWPEELMAASGMPPGESFSSATIGRLRDNLEARVRGDFFQGDVVQLEGWILSRTEARLCALYR